MVLATSDRLVALWSVLVITIAAIVGCSDDIAARHDAAGSDRDGAAPAADAASGVDAAPHDGGSTDAAPDRDARAADAGPVVIPEELRALVLDQWTSIGRNTLADVDPCPSRDCGYSAVEGQSAVLNDWTGGAFASGEGALGGLVYWGGGHNGYYGNEVYFFDLASLRWERRSEPTVSRIPGDATNFELDLDTCTFWDGRPIAFHTYDSVTYVASTNRFFLSSIGDAPAAPPASPEGCSSAFGSTFDLGTGEWSPLADPIPIVGRYVSSAYDASRDAVWVLAQQGDFALMKYDLATATWTRFAGDRPIEIDTTAAIDPVRDLYVVARFRTAHAIAVKDLSDPDARAVDVAMTGDLEITNAAKAGLEWAPELGAFVSWSSGSRIYLLTPPAGDWRTEPWVWTARDLGGTPPSDPVNGPYSKLQYVPGLGIALVETARGEPVHAVRLVE